MVECFEKSFPFTIDHYQLKAVYIGLSSSDDSMFRNTTSPHPKTWRPQVLATEITQSLLAPTAFASYSWSYRTLKKWLKYLQTIISRQHLTLKGVRDGMMTRCVDTKMMMSLSVLQYLLALVCACGLLRELRVIVVASVYLAP